MNFSDTHRYDVGVEALFALYRLPEFWRRKYEFMGHRNVEVECVEVDGGGLRVCTRRDVPIEVPKIAKTFISPVNHVTQIDEYQPEAAGTREGTWNVQSRGKPVIVGGTARLSPRGDGGCTNAITGTIEVKVPVIGKAVSKLLLRPALRALADENTFVARYLADLSSR